MKRSGLFILTTMLIIFIIPFQSYASSGFSLFKSEGCVDCHSVDGKGSIIAENLSHIGRKKSFSWIKKRIINFPALKHNYLLVDYNGKIFKIGMPSYRRLSKKKLNKLTGYLVSLK